MQRPKLRNWKAVAPVLLVAGAIGAGLAVKESTGSDHQQTPLTELNPRLDITDVWAFPGSSDDRIVLGMTIASPLIGNQGAFFDPNALYQFKIDNNQDGFEDLVIQFSFDQLATGAQTVDVIGPVAPRGGVHPGGLFPGPVSGAFNISGVRDRFVGGTPVVRRAALNSAATGNLPAVTGAAAGSMQVFAGLRDDPFYIDLPQFFRIIPDRRPVVGPLSRIGQEPNAPPSAFTSTASAFRPPCGANNQFDPARVGPFDPLHGCAVDFLAGLNALAIVVELPEAQLTRGRGGSDPQIGIWATISR